MQQSGVFVIIGPMFSGKTTELLRRTRRYAIAGRSCLVVKFAGDTRYAEEAAATHDGVTQAARSATKLSEVTDWRDFDVISIDEGQFFPDVVEFADEAALAGKVVLVCGLCGDFRRQPFGRLLDLVPRAERVDKLTAVCAGCGADACFTRRLTAEQAVTLIGGLESYRPVCRSCWAEPQETFVARLTKTTTTTTTTTPCKSDITTKSVLATASDDDDSDAAPLSPTSPSATSSSSSSSSSAFVLAANDSPATAAICSTPPTSPRSKSRTSLHGSPASSVGTSDPSSPIPSGV